MKIGEPVKLSAAPKSVEPARPAPRLWSTLLTWIIVLAVTGGAGYLYYTRVYLPGQTVAAAPPKRPIPILASAVHQGDMDLYLNGLGTVTAFNSVIVRSRVDGELLNVAFTEGQLVKEGDLLAEIDPRPFQVQLDQAEGPLTRDRAAHEIAKLNLERFQQLVKTKNVSQQELDTQASLVKQAEGAIQADLAQIANAKLQLDYCRITSPITGRIGLRLVDRGNMIRSDNTSGLAVVTQLQPISVIFTIPQDEIGRVQLRMRDGAKLQVAAYNRDFSIKLATGELAALDNQVDATTGTVRLKAVFKNENEMLFPNQFVNVRLLVETRPDVILAPTAAVQRGPTFNYVYVLKKDGKDTTVELRKITLGPTEGSDVAVTEGLAAGEQVVTDGLEKLQNGAAVVLRDANNKGQKDGAPAPTAANGSAPTASPPARSASDSAQPSGAQKGS